MSNLDRAIQAYRAGMPLKHAAKIACMRLDDFREHVRELGLYRCKSQSALLRHLRERTQRARAA
jgi:hypothetical protein